MNNIRLSCQCGQVQGIAKDIDPKAGTRLVCYCDDCQAFAQHLNKGAEVLDQYGGTEIYQLTPAQLEITQGAAQIRGLRLTEKGLLRWYAACCNTPIANTISSGVPFVGMVHRFIADGVNRDETLGPISAYVHTKYALKPLPEAIAHQSSTLGYTLKIMGKMLLWKFKGLGNPSPFFDHQGQPICEAEILQREA